MATTDASVTDADAGPVISARATLFAWMLALAVLFHLAGNPRVPFVGPTMARTVLEAALFVVAVIVLVQPRRQGPLVVLCALIPVSAWFEAPIVGNHWVLTAALALTYLAAAAWSRRRDAQAGADAAFAAFLPAARLTVLIAYGFAAFAKLNSSFFDPSVSCAVYYQDQLVRSWGLAGLSAVGQPVLGTAFAVSAACIELSVPVLLLFRRTRRVGLLVALSFHWMLALDLGQHFWDFSAVLFAGFLLFLDAAQVAWLLGTVLRIARATPVVVRRVLAVLAALPLLAVLAVVMLPLNPATRDAALVAGHAAWIAVGTAVLVLVALSTLRAAAAETDPGTFRVPSPVLLVVPLLVAFNGTTPYLELKTGFGWNMYANLETVAGESNHFLIPATLDLTGLQRDQVEILESSDPSLDALAGQGYALAYSEFREYAHTYPEESVTYRRDGAVVEAARIGDDTAGQGGVSAISRRLQSFRVIDTQRVERCQPLFSPAR